MFLKNITKELREVSSELKSLNGKLDKLIEVQSNKDHSYEKELILAVTRVAEAVDQSTLSTAHRLSKLVDLKDKIVEGLFADELDEDFFTEAEEEAHRQLAEELSNLLGDDQSTDDDKDVQSTPADNSSELPDRDLLDLPDETDLRQYAEPLLNEGFVTPLLKDLSDRDVDEEDEPEEDEQLNGDNSDFTITVGRSYLLNFISYVNQIPDLARAIYPDKTGSDFSIFLEALGKVDLNLLGDYIANTEDNFTSMSDFYEIRHTTIFKETSHKVTVEMVKALKPEIQVPESPYTVLPVQEAIEDFFLMAVKFLNGILIERTQAVNAYKLSNEVLRSYVA